MKTDVRKKTLQKDEIIPISYDFLFTNIFNNEENIPILEYLLSALTEYSYSDIKGHIQLLGRDLKISNKKEKSSQVDLVLDFNGTKINIELSNGITEGIVNRNIVYGFNIHSNQLHYGDNDYSNINPTIQIQLNNFPCHQEEIKKTYFLRSEKGEVLSKKFRIDVIDMVKGSKLWYTSRNDKLMRWCKLLTTTSRKEFEEALGDELMDGISEERFLEEVIKFSRDENNIALYMKLPREELERNTYIADAKASGFEMGRQEGHQVGIEEGRIEGRKEGIKEGIKEGKKEGEQKKALEIAKNLKHLGIPIEKIIEATNLNKETIEKL